jgi:hypothetical protein
VLCESLHCIAAGSAVKSVLQFINEDGILDSTITEQDMDASALTFVQSLRSEAIDIENDLAVDGLSDSLMSKVFGFFMFRGK